MDYFLGIDGGGTKTAYLLVNEKGQVISQLETEGITYQELRQPDLVRKFMTNVQCMLDKGKLGFENLTGLVIGLPCYGESETVDRETKENFKCVFKEIPYHITNDVVVGWAGSLAMKPGINIVAGTGSIAYGKNQDIGLRCGGWSPFFGDEGSCYWLGRKAMELFSKQADGRMEKEALYPLIMEHFNLNDPIDFIDLMEESYIPFRSKVAGLQKILLQAAQAGDKSAIKAYRDAAEELSLLTDCLARQLDLGGKPFQVSYSGGLFHAKEFVLPYFRACVEAMGGSLIQPILSPVQGAVLLAASLFSDLDLESLTHHLIES